MLKARAPRERKSYVPTTFEGGSDQKRIDPPFIACNL